MDQITNEDLSCHHTATVERKSHHSEKSKHKLISDSIGSKDKCAG